MVDLDLMRIMPGSYNFAFCITDLITGRARVVRDMLTVEDFPVSTVAISDIEMAGAIGTRRGGRFFRDDVEIIPMPSRMYTTQQKIYIYYELYNLTKDEFGNTAFQISYTIEPADMRREQQILSSGFPTVRRSFRIKPERVTVELDVEYGIQFDESKWLELKFQLPPPGLYDLTLNVKDLNNNTEYTRTQRFMIVAASISLASGPAGQRIQISVTTRTSQIRGLIP